MPYAIACGSFVKQMSSSEANLLEPSQLRTNAFFDFVPPTSSDDQSLEDPLLGNYYAYLHRNRILSDAIPAMSWPAGSHPIPKLNLNARNFNLTGDDLATAVFQNSWPNARLNGGEHNNDWYHSDFDYVAYPFTHKLFDAIVMLGNLK